MNPNYLTTRYTSSSSTVHQYTVNYASGQFYYNSDENRFEFQVASQPKAKRSICPCCVNKQRSRVKGAKATKIFQKGTGLKSV